MSPIRSILARGSRCLPDLQWSRWLGQIEVSVAVGQPKISDRSKSCCAIRRDRALPLDAPLRGSSTMKCAKAA